MADAAAVDVDRLAEQLIVQGNEKEDSGDLPSALLLYEQAVRLAPELPKAHLNLGLGFAASGDDLRAANAYRAGLALDECHPFLNYNFAHLSYRLGDLPGARERVEKALSAKPDFVQAHVLLSNVLDDLGLYPPALEAIDRALELDPQLAGAHLNRAKLLRKLDRFEEALDAAERAVAIDPDMVDDHTMSLLFGNLGLADQALAFIRKAAEADPTDHMALSRELFYSNFDESLHAERVYEAHREFGALLERSVAATYENRWLGSADPDRPLRLGFVSADFCYHPVTLFMLPLLEHLDRSRFKAYCYASVAKPDPATEKMQAAATHWVACEGLSDSELAKRVHDDAIDVLFDLSGHSGAPRLAAFAEKPAPVQITWLGYLNTTGLRRIDYRLCDSRTDPPWTQRLNTEQLLPMPQSQWCYRPYISVDPSPVAPCAVNGYVTFGSFNTARKISEAQCRRWARLLRACRESRLLIADISSPRKRAAILAVFEQEGVPAERIQIEGRADLAAYYRLYDRVDITLDGYPYGGGTTTFDSLWMGVPVLCATGDLPVSRSAASLLALLGLHEWIAPSIDVYVDYGVARAADHGELQRLRKGLRPRLIASPLMDAVGFARDFERVVREAWQRCCALDGA